MTEPQSGGAAAVQNPPTPRPVPDSRPSILPSLLTFVVLALMFVTIFALFQYPLQRIHSDSEVNFNEGWNAYRQLFAQEWKPLYGAPPDPSTGTTNYPPISFHLVGILAGHHDPVSTARWISFISLLVTGILIGSIVRELGADVTIAAFSTLLYVLAITVFLPDRVGMDDPQLLAELFTTAGLYLYIRARSSLPLLCGSALAFCIAGFTKQNLLAFPAAVAVDLLIRSRKRLAIWCGAMVVFAGLLLGLTFAIDGRFFFDHLFPHRAYSLDAGINSITHFYLLMFQGILLVALVWVLVRFCTQPLLAAAFVFSNALAFMLAGGDGVDLNIYFNAIAAAVVICGVALAEIEGLSAMEESSSAESGPSNPLIRTPRMSGAPAFWTSGHAVAIALMLGLFLSISLRVPERLRDGHLRGTLLADDDRGFRAAVDLVKSRPGPALCESLLVCFRAGKPYTFDSYTAIEEIKSHHTDEDATVPLVRRRQFAVIQLDAIPGEAMSNPPVIYRTRSRFTPEFVDALLGNYQLVLRTSHMLIFVPK